MVEIILIGAVLIVAFPVALISWATRGRAARYDVMSVSTRDAQDAAYCQHEGQCSPSRRNTITGTKANTSAGSKVGKRQAAPAQADALPAAFEDWLKNHENKKDKHNA
jgi:hypothetical protein